ncbi:MAG: tyrosine-type recombinase/integrase [Kordiimonadaceae bacterium]|nr:tyrosine-type recombinase/integrase [Kordiimonadaceae bacterium]
MGSKITKNGIDKLKPEEKDKFIWDGELKGFGLKVTPAGNKVFIVQYRPGGRGNPTKRYTIGKYGPLSAEEARKEAKSILGKVAKGTDPQAIKQLEKKANTIAELCDDYLTYGCTTKKVSTIATDKGRIERHIKPLLGRKKVKDLNSADVRKFLRDVARGKTAKNVKTGKHGLARVSGGEGTATRTVGLLGGIMSFAIEEGIRKDNPVKGVKRYPDKKCERFLSPEEMVRLGDALAMAEKEGEYPLALDAIRLLLLTGCRKMEILALTWEEVDFDFGCLRLKDSKTGQKIVPLGKPALQLLDQIVPIDGNPHVFPSYTNDGFFVGLPRVWLRIRKIAGLNDVRLHDLRHSFASVGAGAGLGLPVVGKLLGHADPKTTARYAHIADDPARAAADRISGAIAGSLNGNRSNVVKLTNKNNG